MKRLATLISAAVFAAYAASADTWSLERALGVAREDNPDARVARLRLDSAQAAYAQASSFGRPQISLTGGYTQTNSPMMAFGSILNQRAFDFGLDFNRPGMIDNANATALVGLNVYSGGRVRAGRRAAQAGLEATVQDELATHRELAVAVTRSYLDIRKADEALAAVDAGVEAYEVAVSNAQARFDAGQLLKSDLLSLQAQLAQTREQQLQARHQRDLASRAFLFLLGRGASGEEVRIEANDTTLQRLSPPASLDARSRPELTAWIEREQAALAMLTAARGERRPSVNAFASYQVDKGWETSSESDSWVGGLAVNLNVFDGGATSAKIRMAEVNLSEVREYKRKIELGIGLEIEQARLALEQARERLDVTRIMLEQARESASLSRARFEEGALLTSELIGVESRLIEARMRQALARADERIAVAELRKAVGRDLLAED